MELPPDLGQAAHRVYVEATGHSLRGLFLDYWRANGAASIYGNPISEPFVATDGSYSQAFERGILQYRPEFLHTTDPIVRLMPLGRIALEERLDGGQEGGARASSPGVDRAAAWAAFVPVPDTGDVHHTVADAIRDWYTFNEGMHYLGRPLSELIKDGSGVAQWFEGGLLVAAGGEVALAPLAVDLAARLGIDTAPVDRDDLPLYDELLFWIADLPDLRGDLYAPGAKWIEVGIGEQRLWAYHGQTLIATTLVSTGIAPNATNLGMFRVRLKYPAQDMQGFTDATGEVLGFGEAPAGTIPYAVAAVPHVVYFNMDAEALHGADWHDNFGQQMSHGCINLPPDFAAWLYGWAPLGTGAWVYE